jgi:hypothetical protein
MLELMSSEALNTLWLLVAELMLSMVWLNACLAYSKSSHEFNFKFHFIHFFKCGSITIHTASQLLYIAFRI